MSFKILLFLAFTALAVCETPSFRHYDPMSLLHEGSPESIYEFFGGMFKHFNLTQPSEIPECFGTIDTIAFFAAMHEANKIIIAIQERDNFDLYLHLFEQFILNLLTRRTSVCMAATQDFTDLLDALDIEERDYKLFGAAQYLYLQAHFSKLIKDFKPIIESLDNRKYQSAGKAYGLLIDNMVQTIRKEHFGYLYIAAYANGFSTGAEVSYPSDSLKIWNRTTGGIAMKFLYGLSEAVVEGEKEDSWKNAGVYWEETGKKLLEEIPDSVFEDLQKSKDNKEVTKKFGIDIMSKDFGVLLAHYSQNNPNKFYMDMKLINNSFENLNFMNVGFFWAKYLKLVAES